jgi:pre-mRNA-splicing factor SYF1
VNAIGSGSKQDGSSIDVEVVIRSAIDRYSSECGALWNALAEYFTRLGLFEKARDIYEEAIRKIMTARDFNIVFTAYSQFEESLVAIKLQGGGSSDEFDLDADDVDMRLFRLENLLDRRPFLINDVALRQNPNNVYEWLKRVQLFEESVKTDEEWMLTAPKVLKTFNDAVSTVDPEHASEEKLSKLWLDFSRFHENECNLIEAVRTFQRATEVDFKGVDEHATVWCAWAEFYIRQNQLDDALRILRKAVIVPSKRELQDAFTNKGGLTAKQRLYKSSKLWALLVDLEESLSSFETAKAVYDQILSLRVITPQIVLNYVDFLQKNKFFEESFRVFEKSISLFEYPLNIPLWSSYLLMFVDRFGKSKVDRARELYEEALKTIPKEAPELKSIFIMYADLEEKFGLARNALRIYDRATEDVIQQDQYEMYQLYIAKAASFFGLARTREIYEKAIHKLPEHSIKSMSMQYASVEVKLGEVDRARAVYTYAAQYCNPQRETLFWNTWQEFEVQYGNEDTFRDMLRLKRSVDADFKSRHFVELAAEVDANSREIESRKRKLVEAEEAALAKSQRNEEELNIDEEEDGAEEEKDHIEIQQQSVPSAVYQGITISE